VFNKEINLPFYAKTTFLLIGLFAFFTILYIAKAIIVPIVFSVIIAIVLHPIVNFFVRKKINRVVSIIIILTLTFLIIATIFALLLSQINRLSDSWPILVERFSETLNQTIKWASGYFDINQQKINDWLATSKTDFISSSGNSIGKTLLSVGNSLVLLFLVPVYVFMILFYEPLLVDFIRKLFSKSNQTRINEIFSQSKIVIQRYLIGLVIEVIIVAILNSTGLLILGIDYAILLGSLGAFLNVIPYIGGIIGVGIFMIIAFITKSPVYVLYVLALYSFIQLVDNNFIVPKIVASKVKINALVSIIVVIIGNAIWGIPGMFLSIPLLAIVKLIFDHIESLKPWGFLLGDTMPHLLKMKLPLKKSKPT